MQNERDQSRPSRRYQVFLSWPFDPGKRFSFKGGGGTSFKPVFEYVATKCEQPDLLIYFTDGYGDVPEKPAYPVMWVITPGGKNIVPWGMEAKMD